MKNLARAAVAALLTFTQLSCSGENEPTISTVSGQELGGEASAVTPKENVITNGGFESGASGWSGSGSTSTVTSGAHGGLRAARVGSTPFPSGDSALRQTFTVPQGAKLSLWYQSSCSTNVDSDWLTVELRDAAGQRLRTVVPRTCANDRIWRQATMDLADLAGQQVTLSLANHDDGNFFNASYALFDDVVVEGSTSSDTVPPTASLTAPSNGATLTGTATLSATASDNVRVARVEFYVDTAMVGSDTTEPFSVSWNSASAANGSHQVSARAFDAAGNRGDSAAVTVTTQNSGGGDTGGIGPDGGKVDKLYFAVTGDTRPSIIDDTTNYPTSIINKIYEGINALNPRPQFVVGTGDYAFSSEFGNTGDAQISLYRQASQKFSGVTFAAMGNHECEWRTKSNCPGGGSRTYDAYVKHLVTPLGKPNPYYTIPISARDNSWTAKLVVIACNAWDATQRSWLSAELSKATTHTFIARHEPSTETDGPCVRESQNLINQHPYTLILAGHFHTFRREGTREVVVGTGGALMEDTTPFGYATVEQVDTGFRVTQYDYSTNMPISNFVVPF